MAPSHGAQGSLVPTHFAVWIRLLTLMHMHKVAEPIFFSKRAPEKKLTAFHPLFGRVFGVIFSRGGFGGGRATAVLTQPVAFYSVRLRYFIVVVVVYNNESEEVAG